MTSALNVKAIRVGLATAVGRVPGLTAHPRWPGSIVPPCAVVVRKSTTYDPAFDLPMEFALAVRLYLPYQSGAASLDALDDYLSPTGPASIRAQIDADPTLGGVVQWARMTDAEEEGTVEMGDGERRVTYITTDINIEVG